MTDAELTALVQSMDPEGAADLRRKVQDLKERLDQVTQNAAQAQRVFNYFGTVPPPWTPKERDRLIDLDGRFLATKYQEGLRILKAEAKAQLKADNLRLEALKAEYTTFWAWRGLSWTGPASTSPGHGTRAAPWRRGISAKSAPGWSTASSFITPHSGTWSITPAPWG